MAIAYHIVFDLTATAYHDSREGVISEFVLGMSKSSWKSVISEPLKAKHVGEGVIRLYRELDELASSKPKGSSKPKDSSKSKDSSMPKDTVKPTENSSTKSITSSKSSESLDSLLDSQDHLLVSILAIPSYFTAVDILGYIGESYLEKVSQVKVVRSNTSNRFLVLLLFRERKYAKKFKKEFNGKYFNSMEPEKCHVIYVKKVVYKTKDGSTIDPFTVPDQSSEIAIPLDKPNPPPTPSLQELPTCPVCLERMDSSVTGLLTIPCQHTFHCRCLSKWQDDSCPICRYSSYKTHAKTLRDSGSMARSDLNDKCVVCGITENLWICLICGNIACGRYNHAHAINHFNESGHCFSMGINNQRIWDYASDSYVHRLLTSESDGKLVELSSPSTEGSSDGKSSKSETSYVEYSNILVSQLESQREYYELKLNDLSDSISNLRLANEQMTTERNEWEKKLPDLIQKAVNAKLEKINVDLTKKSAKVDELNKRYLEEKTLASGMSGKISSLQRLNGSLMEKIKEKDKKVKDLEEQVADLMFYLDTKEKLKDAADDVKEGTVVVPGQKAKKKSKKKVAKLPPKEMKIKRDQPKEEKKEEQPKEKKMEKGTIVTNEKGKEKLDNDNHDNNDDDELYEFD